MTPKERSQAEDIAELLDAALLDHPRKDDLWAIVAESGDPLQVELKQDGSRLRFLVDYEDELIEILGLDVFQPQLP